MPSLSRPDLAPRSSPEWQAWYARHQAQQAAKQQQRQDPDARQVAQLVERKKQQGGYGSL